MIPALIVTAIVAFIVTTAVVHGLVFAPMYTDENWRSVQVPDASTIQEKLLLALVLFIPVFGLIFSLMSWFVLGSMCNPTCS